MKRFAVGNQSKMTAFLGFATANGVDCVMIARAMGIDGVTWTGQYALLTTLVNERFNVLEAMFKGWDGAWEFKESETRSMIADGRRF